ncbi:thiol:disulfide interchange protein DsbG [Acidovorax sp. MR-S7]|uniref:thiol:disulfide interchange protein DsbG n=1 Tax=Acidovorax sp. MR-S7 TaxID=1268622 RepID=UPI000367E5B4|nr:protein-disulfide isomerase [Acidovorax sp. MR-S7]
MLVTAFTNVLGAFAATAADDEALWGKLEAAKWVRDGNPKAPRVVYVITDPNCQWCHRFWEASRPWVKAGQVQVRHLLVGIVRSDSARKAAAILGAKDPAAAIEQNEIAFSHGGIPPAFAVSTAVEQVLEANLLLMRELGFRGTPALISRNGTGSVERVAGFPRSNRLDAVMGSPAP